MTFQEKQRRVAGLWCSDVLARLSDYLDGDLSSEEKAQVEAHVRDCTVCAEFGGVFEASLRRLRNTLDER